MTCPSAFEHNRHQSTSLIDFWIMWTLPSPKQMFTPPPVCRLRDIAEVMRLPEVVQPIPSSAFRGLQYKAPSSSSSPPSAGVPPRRLFGVGLYVARPAFVMLAPGNPIAHTPRGSIWLSPARISVTSAVCDVPSVISVSLQP